MADIENEKNIENEQIEEQADERVEQTEADNQQQADAPEASDKASHEKKPWSRKAKMLALAAVLASVAALIAGVNLTMTAFSANSHMKAVAATNESPNLLSSDVLAGYSTEPAEGNYPSKSIIVKSGVVSFSIFNYLQNDPTIYCQRNITYDLTMAASGDGAGKCTYNGAPLANKGVTLTGERLAARQKSENTYKLDIPDDAVNKVVITVLVTVRDSGGTNVRYMAAKIAPSQQATVQSNSVQGQWVEKTDDNKPADFDGYNYDVTVTGAKTSVTLTWNAAYLQIDPNFVTKYGGTRSGNTATLEVDPGTKRISFYRVESAIKDSTTWKDLGVSIK